MNDHSQASCLGKLRDCGSIHCGRTHKRSSSVCREVMCIAFLSVRVGVPMEYSGDITIRTQGIRRDLGGRQILDLWGIHIVFAHLATTLPANGISISLWENATLNPCYSNQLRHSKGEHVTHTWAILVIITGSGMDIGLNDLIKVSPELLIKLWKKRHSFFT